jgi:hypothetical protein
VSKHLSVLLDDEDAAQLDQWAEREGVSRHRATRDAVRAGLAAPHAVQRQPQAVAPQQQASPLPAAGIGGLGDAAQIVAMLRALTPPPQDMTPVLVALASANKGPDLAGLAALMQSLRPEPTPSPWPSILEAVGPIAGPAIAAWAEARASAAGAGSLFAVAAPVLSHFFGDDDDSDDDDSAEAETTPSSETPPPAPRVRRHVVATPSGQQ